MTVKLEKIASIIASARIILLLTVSSEIDLKYTIKESENKDAECIFCNEKLLEDEQGEIWIKCFRWTLQEQRKQSISISLINKLEAQMVFA